MVSSIVPVSLALLTASQKRKLGRPSGRSVVPKQSIHGASLIRELWHRWLLAEHPPQTGGMERPGDRHFWHLEGVGSPAARHPWGPRRGAVGGQAPTRCGEGGGWRAGEGDAGPMHHCRDPRRTEGQTGACTWTWGPRRRVPSVPPPAPRRSFEMLAGRAPGRAPPPSPGDPLPPPVLLASPPPPPPPRFRISLHSENQRRHRAEDERRNHGQACGSLVRGLRAGPPPHSPTCTPAPTSTLPYPTGGCGWSRNVATRARGPRLARTLGGDGANPARGGGLLSAWSGIRLTRRMSLCLWG